MYACRTWPIRLREHRPRRIFEGKMEKVTGGLKKLRNEELHRLYSSPDMISRTKAQRIILK
jgi:hypothetical protein